jgi:hypothetical protein
MSILSNVFSVRFAVVAGSALLLSASAFASSCGTDITAQFTGKVANSPKAPPPFTNKMIALTNNGPDLAGTVYLAIYNVPSGIGLQDFTWTSSCDSLPAGTYFIRVYLGYDNIWEAGTTNKLVLTFVNPNNLPVTFNFAVVKGDQLASPHVVPATTMATAKRTSASLSLPPPPGGSSTPRPMSPRASRTACRPSIALWSAILTAT